MLFLPLSIYKEAVKIRLNIDELSIGSLYNKTQYIFMLIYFLKINMLIVIVKKH